MQISVECLTTVLTTLFERAGAEPANARICAGHLVEANLKGYDSHGASLAPVYLRWIAQGRVLPNQRGAVIHDRGAVLVIDGGFGLGQVVGADAMRLAIDRARQSGIACVALRRSGHLGRIGAYGEQCAEAGLVSMHYVNVVGHAPSVAPFGGGVPRLVTNPYCCVVPSADGQHVVVDFATSAIAIGAAHVAHRRGVPVPAHALVDAEGRPTTDPGTLFADGPRGHLLPFGQHKGGGLQVLCELLGGALAGQWTIQSDRAPGATINNMLSIVIDPEAFGGREPFEREVTALAAYLRSTPPAEGFARVQLPGDPERDTMRTRLRDGLDLDDRTWASLASAAGHLGVDAGAVAGVTGPAGAASST